MARHQHIMSGHRMAIFDLEHCRNRASLSLSLSVCLTIFYRRRVECSTYQLVYAYVLCTLYIHWFPFTWVTWKFDQHYFCYSSFPPYSITFIRIIFHSFISIPSLVVVVFLFGTVYVRYISYLYTFVVVATDRSFCCYILWILFFLHSCANNKNPLCVIIVVTAFIVVISNIRWKMFAVERRIHIANQMYCNGKHSEICFKSTCWRFVDKNW